MATRTHRSSSSFRNWNLVGLFLRCPAVFSLGLFTGLPCMVSVGITCRRATPSLVSQRVLVYFSIVAPDLVLFFPVAPARIGRVSPAPRLGDHLEHSWVLGIHGDFMR